MAKRRKRTTPSARLPLTDQMRHLVRESGLTAYRISAETGISNASLSRFLSGQRGLSDQALNALGEFFGWQIVARDGRIGHQRHRDQRENAL